MSAVLQAFGVIGILSVLLWAGALGLCLMAVRRRAWFPWAVRAVACALLALSVAKWNSARVSAIEVDRSDLVREALARHREAQIRDGEAVDAPRFAETSAADALAQAGSLSETGVPEPAYRRRGKQQRLLENGTAAGPVAGGDPTAGVGESGEAEEPGVRRMKQESVDRANRWDRWNLLAARSTVWIALVGLVGLWVRRFHRLPGSGPALPLAAPWLDAFSPRDPVVALPPGEAELRWFVEHAVRKGERVLLFGGASHPDGSALRKLGIGDSAQIAVRWAGPIAGARELFESVWYGLVVGQVPGGPFADWLREWRAFLEMRLFTRARARAAINVVVCAEAADGNSPELEWLAARSEELNLRLVFAGEVPAGWGEVRLIDADAIAESQVPAPETVIAGRAAGRLLRVVHSVRERWRAWSGRGGRGGRSAALLFVAWACLAASFTARAAEGAATEEPLPVAIDFEEAGGKIRTVKGTLQFERFPVLFEGEPALLRPGAVTPEAPDSVRIKALSPAGTGFEFQTKSGNFSAQPGFARIRVEIGAAAQLDRASGGDLKAAPAEEISLEEKQEDESDIPMVFESAEVLPFRYLDVARIREIRFPLDFPAERKVTGRFPDFSRKATGSGGAVRVVAASFLGGAFDEAVVAAGFLADGRVIAVMNAFDTSFLPGAALLGSEPADLAPARVPPEEKRNFPRALLRERSARSEAAETHMAPFVVCLDSELKGVERSARLPFGSMKVAGALVHPDGAVTLWGGALPGWKGIGTVAHVDNPAALEAAKGKGKPIDPESGSLVVRLEPGLQRIAWARFYQADSVQLFVRKSGNVIVRTGRAFEELTSAGESVPSGIGPIALGGQRRGLFFNPADDSWFAGGDYDSGTGHEPYRNPWLRKFRADGTPEWSVWDWTGPVVGVKRYRLVSDSAVRAVRFMKNGEILVGGWSDGGNTVFYRQPIDLSRAHDRTGFAASLWGAGVLSVAHLQRLDPATLEVRAATTCTSFLPLDNKPNSIMIADLAELDNGLIAVTGGAATGLIETHDAWTEPWVSMSKHPGADKNPLYGVKSGPFFALFGPDFKAYPFCSVVPGLRSQRIAVREDRVLVFGAAAEVARTPGVRDGSILKDSVQARFGGGNTDGYLLLIDAAEGRVQ
jgi:hypothetical protein